MKPGKRIVWSIYTAIIVYLILNFFIGDFGLIEKQRLSVYRDALNGNINRLYRTGSELEAHSVSLRSDPDMVALFARELGYLRDNELLVRIDGYGNSRDRYTVGRTLMRREDSGGREPFLRSLAGISGILMFLGFSFFRKQQHD